MGEAPKYASRHHLRSVVNNTNRAMANWREADVLFSEAAVERASDPEQLDAMSTLQAVTAGAICRDKVAANERQDGGQDDRLSPFEQLAQAAMEGKISLEIRVEPVPAPPGAVSEEA